MSPQLKYGMVALLAAFAESYFVICTVNAKQLASVLLGRGWSERGWTQERLEKRIRVLSAIGAVLAGIAFVVAVYYALR